MINLSCLIGFFLVGILPYVSMKMFIDGDSIYFLLSVP